jgi:hypothetical protein
MAERDKQFPAEASKMNAAGKTTGADSSPKDSSPVQQDPRKNWRELHGRRVHPAADIFPEMPAGELRDLGADIKKRGGLLEPISYYEANNGEEVLLDGRNRIAAAELVEKG